VTPLDADAVAALLGRLPGWRRDGDALTRTFRFPSFAAAVAFMARCVPDIDRLGHHPEWRNVYDQVEVRLTTHDAGGRITALDGQLAELLDRHAADG
jgi:4a-hydroxytetrahydrobiopterin dehydratase